MKGHGRTPRLLHTSDLGAQLLQPIDQISDGPLSHPRHPVQDERAASHAKRCCERTHGCPCIAQEQFHRFVRSGRIDGTGLSRNSYGGFIVGISLYGNVEGVERFKCIQHSPREMEVLVVPGARWQASAEQEIVGGLRARLGAEVAVKLQLVDDIAPEISGKHRYVVSHVKPAGALAQACSRD